MKTHFKSDELPHIWAHKKAPCGTSPGSMSFDGDAFKSYATVIARRIEYKGKTAYLVDCYGFSPITSAHQHHVLCAIPPAAKTFIIHNGERGQRLDFTPQTLRDFFVKLSAEIEAREPSRLARKRAEQYMEATSALRSAVEVCEFFGLPSLSISSKIDKREAQNTNAAQLIADAKASRDRAKLLREKKEAKARLLKNIAFAEAYLTDPDAEPIYDAEERRIPEGFPLELLGKFLARVKEVNAGALDAWRNGANIRLPFECPVLLRVESASGVPGSDTNQPEMVTSKGARVPLADAEKTFRFVSKLRAKGWHRNGETHEVGGYQLDAVNEFGVVAGCHRVSWEEITRFAKSQGWTE